MDRRVFLKTVLSSSAVLPLSAALGRGMPVPENAWYVLTDFPQDVLPLLLSETGSPGRRVAFAGSHPLAEKVESALLSQGWTTTAAGGKTDVLLSFASLDSVCTPSFTLIQNGGVVDIRRSRLFSLWKDMSLTGRQSSVLTVARLSPRRPVSGRGSRAAVYIDGKKKETLDLSREAGRTYESAGGFVAVSVIDGRASVSDSSCRQKICLCSSAVSAAGERIICAPNRFYLEVEGRGRVDTVIG